MNLESLKASDFSVQSGVQGPVFLRNETGAEDGTYLSPLGKIFTGKNKLQPNFYSDPVWDTTQVSLLLKGLLIWRVRFVLGDHVPLRAARPASAVREGMAALTQVR